MEQVRSFVAIKLSDELKAELAQLQAQLKIGQQSSVKWVNPHSIHLTLKFLGSVAMDRIGEITGAIEAAARGIPPFCLEVKELGAFPNLRRVQVVWVGISGEVHKLRQIQQHLDSNLARLGFTPESRAFAPHLTLGRFRERTSLDERQNFGQMSARISVALVGTIEVNAINLMKSQLTREGVIYSRISSVGLRRSTSW